MYVVSTGVVFNVSDALYTICISYGTFPFNAFIDVCLLIQV